MAEIADEVWSWLRDPDREDDQVWLRFRSGLPADVAAERVRKALTAEGGTAGPDGLNFGSKVVPTPEGPTVLVDDLELAARLPKMVAELDRVGVSDGRIELYRPLAHRVLTKPVPVPYVECRLAVRAQRLPPRPWHGRGAWAVDPADQEEIAAAAVAWCLDLPGPRTACWTYAELVADDVTADRALAALRTICRACFAAPQPSGHAVRFMVESGAAFRTAVLGFGSGHVSFVDGTVEPAAFQAESSLSAVVQPAWGADWAVRGFCKRGNNWAHAGNHNLKNGWVSYPADRVRSPFGGSGWGSPVLQREVEQHSSADAFGALLIPNDELDQVAVADSWTIEPAGNLTLLRHRDLNAWFAAPKPDSDVLTAARGELDPLLPPRTN